MSKYKKKLTEKIRIKDLQPKERPKDRLMRLGPQALSDAELLAILLWKGFVWKEKGLSDTVINTANRILSKYNIKKLSQASVGELVKLYGIGEVKASQIVAALELGRRLASYTEETKPLIETPEDVFRILGPEMQALEQECVKVVLLDNRNRMIKAETVTVGTLDTNVIHPRELFKSAIDNNAASVTLVHNHPSGDANPSDADIELSKRIIEAGNIVGMEVQDHIIIGDKGLI